MENDEHMSQIGSVDPEAKGKDIDQARRRLAKAALAAPVLMSIPGKQVFASGGSCTLSGDLSGNVSDAGGHCNGNKVFGRSPGYWKNHVSLLDPNVELFKDHFGSTKFGDLTFLQVIELAEGACSGGGVPPYDAYCGLPEEDRQLARHAVAAYLNAYDSEAGGTAAVDPGYYFSTGQVVGLYLTVEDGGGIYNINGIDYFFTRLAVIDMYFNSFA